MACENPIPAHRPANGGPVSFTGPKKNGHAWIAIQLPCGYCILCREEQARQQAVRITHEANMWDENSFITLTYADKHLPPHGSLNYDDLEKFWKRLRKRYGRLRYYAVGEYGDQTLRPHYHACVFGQAFTEARIMLRDVPNALWTSPFLQDAWGLGNVSVGALNFQTAAYTASYVVKKLRSKQKYVRIDEQTGELIPVQQPKARMSRNIAKSWWLKHGDYVTNHDFVVIGGKRQKPPKAYDRWLGEVNKEKIEKIKEQRMKKATQETETERRARARDARTRAKNKKKII